MSHGIQPRISTTNLKRSPNLKSWTERQCEARQFRYGSSWAASNSRRRSETSTKSLAQGTISISFLLMKRIGDISSSRRSLYSGYPNRDGSERGSVLSRSSTVLYAESGFDTLRVRLVGNYDAVHLCMYFLRAGATPLVLTCTLSPSPMTPFLTTAHFQVTMLTPSLTGSTVTCTRSSLTSSSLKRSIASAFSELMSENCCSKPGVNGAPCNKETSVVHQNRHGTIPLTYLVKSIVDQHCTRLL